MTEIAIRDEAQYLETIEQVRALAVKIKSVDGAKRLADEARTLEVWARRAKLGHDKVDLAITARMWAERRAGELIRDDPTIGPGKGKGDAVSPLGRIGVSKKQSSRWQKLAEIPEAEFEQATIRTRQHADSGTGIKSAGRSRRDTAKRQQRAQAEATAREALVSLGDRACLLEHADLRSWRPTNVACVVTDPPYITTDAVELHSALADFAVDVLPDHGALAVMTWQPILPAVLKAMERPSLVYRWTIAWTYATSERTPERKPRVFDGWKPILVFHKGGWTDETTYLYDTVTSQDADKDSHEWGQSVDGFRQLVRAFSEPGELVCDPFLGGGTTAVAAAAETRRFVGCDISADAVETTRCRLEQAA